MRLITIIMLKIFKRINSLLKILFYKIVYSKSLKIGISTILYPRVHIIIEKTGNVEIGKNCWIAANVTILKGTSIGDNCVIGTGCVVKGLIPSSSIVTQESKLKITQIEDRKL